MRFGTESGQCRSGAPQKIKKQKDQKKIKKKKKKKKKGDRWDYRSLQGGKKSSLNRRSTVLTRYTTVTFMQGLCVCVCVCARSLESLK